MLHLNFPQENQFSWKVSVQIVYQFNKGNLKTGIFSVLPYPTRATPLRAVHLMLLCMF